MGIDGKKFQKMCASAANSLDSEKNEINNLNVFPVPDGDTGINMSLTMKPAREIHVEPGTLSEYAGHVADRFLRSARGNSGAILSLFFRGMAKSFKGLDEAETDDIAKAIRRGTDEAYRAVSKPAEGTILTVMRGCADTAEAESEQYRGNPEAFFERLVMSAEEVLEKTPDMLPVLKEAHVVDAGGRGFVTMLKGMLASLKGRDVAENQEDGSSETVLTDSADFGEFHTEAITFSYCTECIVGKSEAYRGENTVSAFRDTIAPWGDSMVFVDDEEIIKLHIHTNDPGRVLSEAIKYGALETVKVENMRLQHSALISSESPVPAPEGGSDPALKSEEPVRETEESGWIGEEPFGFVSVCLGDGVADTFRELGVQEIVTGGQTMNPSTDDILSAILRTNGREVFVLPNNKNIIMVARQAVSIIESERTEGKAVPHVTVLETRSVPEGLSAMLTFDPETSVESNEKAMKQAFSQVHTLQVTRAVRDAAIDGLSIKAGEYMGLCDRKIGYTGTDYEIILLEMVRNFPDASFVTIFYGMDISEENARIIFEKIKASVPDAECNLIRGGQPLYDFVVSVE